MTALVGGLVAVALGLIGLGIWWRQFLDLLAGSIPLFLLLGGALAVYLGYEEAKDKLFAKTPAGESPGVGAAEVEKYKEEVEKLKAEIEALKAQKKEGD